MMRLEYKISKVTLLKIQRYTMAKDTSNTFEFFQTLQEESLRLFEMAIQTTCQKLDEIGDEVKVRMENLLQDFVAARENIENQIAVVHEHSLNLIRNLVTETEKYIFKIWDETRTKILSLVNTIVTLVDTDKINMKIEEFTSFMTMKVGEFNQRVKEHADEIVTLQQQFFDNAIKRLQTE